MSDWKPRMQKAVRHFAGQLAGFRTGTISIGFSGWIARGVLPRSDLGQPGDRILITPFDKAVVPAIVRALNEARLNAYALNPSTVSVIHAERIERGEDRHPPGFTWLSRQKALNVVADVPGLGEAGRVTDDEGDIEVARQESDEVGNPRARGTDGEDVRLLDSHIDLITYFHGLHDVGDKLGLVARAASRLVEDGWFAGGHPEPGGAGGDERPGARAVS
jgi:hypothetical protein